MSNGANKQSTLERRIATFSAWIRPTPEAEATIRRQAKDVRDRICAEAQKDKLVVRETPSSGSFAKNTGLRRHITGGSPVEGQDVDLPFVLSPKTRDEQELNELLNRFQSYADRAYPQSPPTKSRTKSSIKLEFVGSALSYDLVPLLVDTEDPSYQILLRGNGERRRTSIARHIDFIKRRTDESNRLSGPVRFNEALRLFKWWRIFREDASSRFTSVPTMLIDLLCASAFDRYKVAATYGETLLKWFDFLSLSVQRRDRVAFTDFAPTQLHAIPGADWLVLDPVNPKNNVAAGLHAQHVDELAGWLRDAREELQKAIDYDRKGNDQLSLFHLKELFGPPFKQFCGG